jgi:Flp pilus assembly protein CpaB
MFALTLALLTGLGAVVAARYAGWLTKPEAVVEKKEELKILVAKRNLYPGDIIDSSWVTTRALKPEEKNDYEANKQEYLPAVEAAATLRIPKKAIEADSPILRKDLLPMVKPEPLHTRLLPNMRAVNISVQKDASAGGLIQVGEWVDVYLTSTVVIGSQETTRTAPAAQALRVIAKRNALWPIFANLPEGKPVNFTLEANPYRAGLLEFSKIKGNLTLVPLSAAEQRVLEDRRTKLLASLDGEAKQGHKADNTLLPVSFAQPGSSETNAEEGRVDAFNKGEYTISHADLIRIFDLTTPPPPRSNHVVEQFSGLARNQITTFDPDGRFLRSEDPRRRQQNAVAPKTNTSAPADFAFGPPGSRVGANCPTCKKK